MPITFKLYDDAALTTEADLTVVVEAKSDLSDGAHDFHFYFGSTDVNQKLQAVSNPGVDNVVLTPTYILPFWMASHVYALGDSVVPDPTNGYRYQVTTAGTSAASQPTWGVILNGTTNDGTVVWQLVAEDSPTSEIKLATTQAGLTGATGGTALSLGATVLSGIPNAISFWMRVTNTITQVSESVGTPELGVNINAVYQSSTT